MESVGSWTLDSNDDGFEKMEGNIYAQAVDFLKFGVLFLNNGNWHGKQLVPERWVTESTQQDSFGSLKYDQFMRLTTCIINISGGDFLTTTKSMIFLLWAIWINIFMCVRVRI